MKNRGPEVVELKHLLKLWGKLDRHCADPFRRGIIFRWSEGPAKDSSGIEPWHKDHVHLAWYRSGPATPIFDTPSSHDSGGG